MKKSAFDMGYEDAMDGCDPVLHPDKSYMAGYREGIVDKGLPNKAKNVKDSFMIFTVSMSAVLLAVLGIAVYSAGFFWHWWP